METEEENPLALDEEEKQHRRDLQLKYRDRAKERREGKLFDYLDEELFTTQQSGEAMFSEGLELNKMKKGLDFDLLKKEIEQQRKIQQIEIQQNKAFQS
jgi:hypothetical protein